MTSEAIKFLKNFTGKPFIVQFVMSVRLEGNETDITEITSYLIPAENKKKAIEVAQKMVDPIPDSYRNKKGEVVTTICLGIHSIEELNFVYDIFDDGQLELGVFLFTKETLPIHLIREDNERPDLPMLDQ